MQSIPPRDAQTDTSRELAFSRVINWPVIETYTVIEQQFDIIHNQRFAVFIYRILQLTTNFLHAINDGLSFLLGQMQSFIGII